MKTFKLFFYLVSIGFYHLPLIITGQTLPQAAEPQTEPILLTGGTVHIGDGGIMDNTAIGFDHGKITYVGKLEDIGKQKTDYKIIDVTGQHIYPGFILLNSSIGLQEISAVPHSNDVLEEGDINPSLKTVFAFDTGSTYIPTLRFNGILLVESIRSGGMISGTSAVMELDGWNWEEAAFKKEAAIHLHWPSSLSSSYDAKTRTRQVKKNTSYDSKKKELQNLFSAAKTFVDIKEKRTNLKLEALQGLFNADKVLAIHANEPGEIVESIKFAKSFGVQKIVLMTSYSALLVKDFLKENSIPVVLPPTYNYPRTADMDYDAYYKLPYLLHNEGIMVALNHSGSLSNSMNLPFYAGTAVAFGLNKEEALKMITLNPAKMLGIDGRVGSIEIGKDASLFVSKGDALDIQNNSLSMAFIQGKRIKLDGPHQENFERYSQLLGHGE